MIHAKVPTFTHAQLIKLIHYDPITGIMTWRESRGRCKAGEEAGWKQADGHRAICLFRENWYVSRLAVFYMTGEYPPPELVVDHENRIRDDNRWKNIRVVTQSVNVQNSHYMEQAATRRDLYVGT